MYLKRFDGDFVVTYNYSKVPIKMSKEEFREYIKNANTNIVYFVNGGSTYQLNIEYENIIIIPRGAMISRVRIGEYNSIVPITKDDIITIYSKSVSQNGDVYILGTNDNDLNFPNITVEELKNLFEYKVPFFIELFSDYYYEGVKYDQSLNYLIRYDNEFPEIRLISDDDRDQMIITDKSELTNFEKEHLNIYNLMKII